MTFQMSRKFESLISEPEYQAAVKAFEEFLDRRLELRKPLEHHQPPLTSPGSKRIYLVYVKKFLNDMGFEYRFPFTSDVAREYLARYRRRGAKPRTLLVIYSALKNFYACMGWDFDIDYREILTEPVDPFSEEPYLTMEEIEKVTRYAEEEAEASAYYRDVVIIHLLRQAMRPAEIASLKIENISRKTYRDEEGEGGQGGQGQDEAHRTAQVVRAPVYHRPGADAGHEPNHGYGQHRQDQAGHVGRVELDHLLDQRLGLGQGTTQY